MQVMCFVVEAFDRHRPVLNGIRLDVVLGEAFRGNDLSKLTWAARSAGPRHDGPALFWA